MNISKHIGKADLNIIRNNIKNTNWQHILQYFELPEDFLRQFTDYVDWETLLKYQNYGDDFEREFDYK